MGAFMGDIIRESGGNSASQNRYCGEGQEGQAVYLLAFPFFCLSLVRVVASCYDIVLRHSVTWTLGVATGEAGASVGAVLLPTPPFQAVLCIGTLPGLW